MACLQLNEICMSLFLSEGSGKVNSSNEIMSSSDEDLLDNVISRVQKEKKNDDDQEDNFLGSLENFMENFDKT